MANLLETAELAFRQMFPNPGDETGITREEFISSAKEIYAEVMWFQAKQERREEGRWDVPSHLLTQKELDVKDNKIDISKLKILRSLPNDTWLQNIGGLTCTCTYMGSNVNRHQLLCDDEFQDEAGKTYIILGNEIFFPNGVHTTPLPIIYANNGIDLDSKRIEIDDAIASAVRKQLVNLYLRKGVEDTTNNTSSNI